MIDIKSSDVLLLIHSSQYRNTLVKLIEDLGMTVIVMEDDLDDLTKWIDLYSPRLILLDVFYIDKKELSLEEWLHRFDLPFIILSSRSVHDTAKTVYAITSGASDFILQDQLHMPYYEQEAKHKIKSVTSTFKRKEKKEEQLLEQVDQTKEASNKQVGRRSRSQAELQHIVAIGTSTGGPKALQAVLAALPKNFPAPIVIVQHMPSGFTKSLADRLNHLCQIKVKEAVNGESLQAGTAYIAPGNYHLAINDSLETVVFKEAERDGHRPSVNILFESIAPLKSIQKIVVILTGMGKDGASGVTSIKQQDETAIVIAESEETAVIHGMPRATIETGYVTEVHRLENIGETILHYTMKRGI